MSQKRLIVAATEGYTVRREQYQGREHLVVPVIALVEGVVRAMNSKHGNEFVPKDLLGLQPQRWEGKPLYEGHPLVDGKPIIADRADLRAARSFGIVRNAKFDDKLLMEAWLDTTKRDKAPLMFERAEKNEPIEISVGVLVATEEGAGEYAGRSYGGTWVDYDPDHLALLPDGVLGACSRTMGCGIRAAMQSEEILDPAALDEIYLLWADKDGNDDHGRGEANKASARADKATKAAKDARSHQQAKEMHETAAGAHDTVVKNLVGYAYPKPKTEAESHLLKANAHRAQATMHLHLQNSYEKHASAYSEDIVDNMYMTWLEAGTETDALIRGLRNIPQSVRDKMPKEDFAGPNESFPIEQAIDVRDAAQALGRAKGDRSALKSKIVKIAYRKGSDFVAALPDDWKRKSDVQAASKFARAMEGVRELFKRAGVQIGYETAQDATEMGSNDLRKRLYDAVKEVESNIVNIEDYFPVTDPTHVVYSCYDGMSSWNIYERSFTLSDAGVVTLSAQKFEVQQIQSWEPIEGASPTALEQNRGEGGADSSQQPEKEIDMTKEQIVKALQDASTLTPCQLVALQAALEGKTPAAPKEPTEAEIRAAADTRTAEINTAVAAAITALTFDQVLAKAPANVRDLISTGTATGEAVKTKTIKGLMDTKRCPYTEDELKAMSQNQLDNLVKLAGDNVRAAIDFGGAGAPASGQQSTEDVPDMPDVNEKIRAASAKK